MDFTEFIEWLYNIGVGDVLLPFILIFTLIFAILQKTNILGKGEEVRKFNVMIALAISLSVIIPHIVGVYPPGRDVVDIINSILPNVSALIVIGLLFLLLLGVFSPNLPKANFVRIIGIIFGVVTLIVITLNAFGFYQMPSSMSWLADEETQMTIVVLIVFGLLVWWITSPSDKRSNKKPINWKWLLEHEKEDNE